MMKRQFGRYNTTRRQNSYLIGGGHRGQRTEYDTVGIHFDNSHIRLRGLLVCIVVEEAHRILFDGSEREDNVNMPEHIQSELEQGNLMLPDGHVRASEECVAVE